MKSATTHVLNLFSQLIPAKYKSLRTLLYRTSGIKIGHNVSLGAGIFFNYRNVIIEDNVWIGPWCKLYSTPKSKIIIMKNTDIGPETSFITGSHDVGSCSRRAGPEKSENISIGSGCWIGARCCILGGVKIGAGSIVGAGSLVLPGEYPNNSLIVGTPAKIKRKIEECHENTTNYNDL